MFASDSLFNLLSNKKNKNKIEGALSNEELECRNIRYDEKTEMEYVEKKNIL